MYFHSLQGCTPVPLACYLKALGILRLVAEQADPSARGWWTHEHFCMLSQLSQQQLENFFLEKYEPTPLLAPWNGGSGFYPSDNREALQALLDSKAPRFASYRAAIKAAVDAKAGLNAKPDEKQKQQILKNCAWTWRGPLRDWFDAAIVLNDAGEPYYPSLLGTGGNDGRLDFTNNFMQQLNVLFDVRSDTGQPHSHTHSLLRHALWAVPDHHLRSASIGQYLPGSAGGANSSTGFDSGNLINPWDFVLMLEGAVLFSCQATRRLDCQISSSSKASAPFAVFAQPAGFASPGTEKADRGEQWMPLWDQPATLMELRALISEARLQLGRRIADRPIDVARAIGRLGVSRGVSSFVRYGYLERNGRSNFAVPLGRIPVRYRPYAYLIDDLAHWMDRLGRECRSETTANRLKMAERRLADVVLAALTHDYSPDRWQAILLAIADIETLQASGTGFAAGVLHGLHPDWLHVVNDGSPEFRLALALGSAAADYRHQQPIDPVRHHVLPLDDRNPRRFQTVRQQMTERLMDSPRVVVTGRDPLRDLAAIVERRLIEAAQQGQRRSRLVAAPGCAARLDDLARFLRGALDVQRLWSLARALMAVNWRQWDQNKYVPSAMARNPNEVPEECWLAVRLCCLPFHLDQNHDIPADERLVRLLLSGQPARAIEIARQRLFAVGIRPPIYAGTTSAQTAVRWAAALAFPIDRRTAREAAQLLDPSYHRGLTYA
jgi:CRISPR-associated protein Csx17